MKNLLLAVALFCAFGCGSDAPDQKVEANRLESATKIRTLFDKTGGDYTKLSPQEKTDLLALFGGNEADAQKSWNFMKDRGQSPTGATPGAGG